MKPQEFSSLLWAASKLGQQWGKDKAVDELFLSAVRAINAHADQHLLQKLSVHSVVNILRACNSYLGQAMLGKAPFQAFGEKLLSLSANWKSENDRYSPARGGAKTTWCYEDADESCNEDPCHSQLVQQQLHPSTDEFDCINVKQLSSQFTEPTMEFQAMEPAYVQLPKSAVQAPALDIIHDATFEQEDGSVFVTFEVNSAEMIKTYNIMVQIFHGDKLTDTFGLPVDVGHGIQNTHVLEINGPGAGSYEVHFTLIGILGEIMGEKTVLGFDRKSKSGFVTSESKVNPANTKSPGVPLTEDTVSTCTGSDHENQF